jgi:hypothetical protein
MPTFTTRYAVSSSALLAGRRWRMRAHGKSRSDGSRTTVRATAGAVEADMARPRVAGVFGGLLDAMGTLAGSGFCRRWPPDASLFTSATRGLPTPKLTRRPRP